MFTNAYDDNKVLCVLESILLASVVILAIQKGYDLATFLTNSLNIPFNLTLSIMSFGFGNNIIVLSVVFAITLTVFLIEKVIPDLVWNIVWH